MKRISLLAVAVALLFTGTAFATEVDPCSEDLKFLEPAPSTIGAQIRELLKEHNGFNLGEQDEIQAIVRFTLNSDKEIVVLSVNTENERLENFVKARLNYEKAGDRNLVEGKIYAVPVRLRT
jgi:hypothetical protein